MNKQPAIKRALLATVAAIVLIASVCYYLRHLQNSEIQEQKSAKAEQAANVEASDIEQPASCLINPRYPACFPAAQSQPASNDGNSEKSGTDEGRKDTPLQIGCTICDFIGEHWNDICLTLFTGLLALYTYFLWKATDGLHEAARLQSQDMKASLQISRDAADAAVLSAKAAIGIELPILKAIPIELASTDKPIQANESYASAITSGVPSQYSRADSFQFKNQGRTPAYPILISAGWEVARHLPPEPLYTQTEKFDHGLAIKQDDVAMPDFAFNVELTDAERAAIGAGREWLWLYGEIKYTDFMGMRREMRFCWRYANRNPVCHTPFYFFESDGDPPEAYYQAPAKNA